MMFKTCSATARLGVSLSMVSCHARNAQRVQSGQVLNGPEGLTLERKLAGRI
jgi:hypothetical protein